MGIGISRSTSYRNQNSFLGWRERKMISHKLLRGNSRERNGKGWNSFRKSFREKKKMKKLKPLVPLLSLSTGWQTKIDFSVTFKFSSNLNGSNYGSILRFRYKPVL